ncbi:MAG: hypothetical protein JW779_15265 [Candidatus Thorarchaeota archaeon]|nr:hypothetical protein [Candidatus Thorarchaeota archaeon]
MVIDQTVSNYEDVRIKLYQSVVQGKISSLELISQMNEMDEDSVRQLLQELIDEGTIEGNITEDGKRFFLADAKVSDAPIILKHYSEPEIGKVNTKTAKILLLTGFLMMVAGSILRGLIIIHVGMENAGVALFMIGLVVLTAGWIQFSRSNPPSNIK